MKEYKVKPIGLKGQESIDRMKFLMGESIDRTVKNSVVELTKEGPDGKIYGIVRENHNYFIKITDKTSNLLNEDFKYIGGVANKFDFCANSYSNALKKLNLKFISLNEALNTNKNINVFINEHHGMKANSAFSETNGVGNNDEYVEDGKGKKLDYKAKVDTKTSGDNVADGDVEKEWDEVSLTETESDIDRMITGDVVVNETKKSKSIFSIGKAMSNVSSVEDKLNKLNTIAETLSGSELDVLLNALKKKA